MVSGNGAIGPFGQAAKKYRDAGWLGTLPLPPKLKEAPPGGYHGHGAPYPTPAKIANWLSRNKNGNICLRLGEVPNEFLGERKLPFVYAGNQVEGWELIGIDVDDYTKGEGYKSGAIQLATLEAELGPLPATVVSSSRWETNPLSGTRVFLVPKGFRYPGKAVPRDLVGPKHIDILYAGLRYLVVWPSTNPHAGDSLYRWRYGVPGSDAATLGEYDAPPPMADVAVLPEPWFEYLNLGDGAGYSADTDLNFGELWDWLGDLGAADWPGEVTTGPDGAREGGWADTPCALMRRETAKYIRELEASDSHHPLNTGVWRLVLNAIEGHSGIHWALNEYVSYWLDDVSGDKRDPSSAAAEANRNVESAIAKAKNIFENERNGVLPTHTCSVGTGAATSGCVGDNKSGEPGHSRAGDWADRYNAETADGPSGSGTIADGDYGGLGPVIGPVELKGKPADSYERNDVGNAQHLVDLFDGNLRYVGARKSWVVWAPDTITGLERWHRDYDNKLIRAAFKAVAQRQKRFAMEQDDKDARATWAKWAVQSGNGAKIRGALEQANACYVGAEPTALDVNRLDGSIHLLGCANGTLDLTPDSDGDVNLNPPRKEDFVTYNTGVPYRPWRSLATAEDGSDDFAAYLLWQEYLNEFLPGAELQLFVRKVLGHMLIGENPEKKIVFLFGPRDTGKSTLIGAVSGALGDYYGTIDMSLFKNKELNPGLVRAVPLRVTGMSEMEDNSKSGVIDAAVVKRLTGNDRVVAELKFSNEIFEGQPQFTTVIACNNPPRIPNADPALYERLLVLPLEKQVSSGHRKYDRQKQIHAVAGVAVLAWLVEGWKDYCREGLRREDWPAVVKRANRAFVGGLNNTQEYIAQYLMTVNNSTEGKEAKKAAQRKAKGKNKTVLTPADYPIEWTPESNVVYQHYCRMTKSAGGEPVTQQRFTNELNVGRTGVRTIEGRNVSVYMGVKVREDIEDSRAAGMGMRLK